MAERSHPGACAGPPPLVLRNGSARDRPLPQVLEAQEHGQHPFELSVEMDLVAAEPLQLSRRGAYGAGSGGATGAGARRLNLPEAKGRDVARVARSPPAAAVGRASVRAICAAG